MPMTPDDDTVPEDGEDAVLRADNFSDAISESPIAAVIMALIAGIIIGRLVF
jgi:hypothetical protein